ncbi:MAG: DUF6605 domain-containing protein [Pirellulales bacterium]
MLVKSGFGTKRLRVRLEHDRPHSFRLLSDRLLGYAWPKWCRAGNDVEFRVHAVEPYKLALMRHGYERRLVRNVGWYDDHGPRATAQSIPDGDVSATGADWRAGHRGIHLQRIAAPDETGLYYFHAKTMSGAYCSFPLVVAPQVPTAPIAVLASTNTWTAYNPFGGRSNYIMASRLLERPITSAVADLPRYQSRDYAEWQFDDYDPLSFDRPEPHNQVREHERATDPIEGRSECHLAPAEWRVLAWLEREGFAYDLYAEADLDNGSLDLDAYRVLLLNTHPEYWSAEMYERAKRWVFERGGKLVYLGGNGINCRVEMLDERTLRFHNRWTAGCESRFHAALESEANLLGVVYTDAGAMTSAPYRVDQPDHWVLRGTAIRAGERFGRRTLHERYGDGASGHETDKTSPHTPSGAEVIATGTNRDQGGAEMVHFRTPSGGEVFSAGSITFGSALLCDAVCSQITHNVLRQFLG